MAEARLGEREVKDLVASILEGVAHVDEGEHLRESWPGEMTDWCVLLLDRLDGGG